MLFPTENGDHSGDSADTAGHYCAHCGVVSRTEVMLRRRE